MRLTLAGLAGARDARLAVLLAFLLPGGCSYRFSLPPPARPLQWEGECETSRAPVGGDIVGSLFTGSLALGAFAAAGGVAARASDQTVPSWNPEPDREGLVPLLVIGALSTVATVALIRSAGYGLRSANACEAARADLMSRRLSWPPPPGWTWPAPPNPSGPPSVVAPPGLPPPAAPQAQPPPP